MSQRKRSFQDLSAHVRQTKKVTPTIESCLFVTILEKVMFCAEERVNSEPSDHRDKKQWH